MPDTQDTLGNVQQQTPSMGVDPNWIQGLQDYLDGKESSYDPRQGVPPGYKVENGQVVQESPWDEWGKGAVEFFAPAAASMFLPGLLPSVSGDGVGPTLANTAIQTGAKKGVSSILQDILSPSSSGGSFATDMGTILGGAAKNAQNQNNINAYLNQNAKSLALAAPGSRLSTALRAVLGKYAAPTTVNWGGPGSGVKGQPVTFSGGPQSVIQAAHDPLYGQLSDLVAKDALLGQQRGGPSGGNQDATGAAQSSILDKILGGAATGTSILGAAGKSGILSKLLNPTPPGGYGNPSVYSGSDAAQMGFPPTPDNFDELSLADPGDLFLD